MTVEIKTPKSTRDSLGFLTRAKRRHREAIRHSMFDIGAVATKDLKDELTDPKRTGNFARRNGVLLRRSAPGEYPAHVTGELARSVDYSVKGDIHVEIGEAASYASELEHGTRNIAARPHIEPTSDKFANQFASTLESKTKRELKR